MTVARGPVPGFRPTIALIRKSTATAGHAGEHPVLPVALHAVRVPGADVGPVGRQARKEDRNALEVAAPGPAVELRETAPLDTDLAGQVIEEEDPVADREHDQVRGDHDPAHGDGQIGHQTESRQDEEPSQVERVLRVAVGAAHGELLGLQEVARRPEADSSPMTTNGRPIATSSGRRPRDPDERRDEQVDDGDAGDPERRPLAHERFPRIRADSDLSERPQA
jgi:hypothetical protein